MTGPLGAGAARFGWLAKGSEPAAVFYGDDAASFAFIAPLIEALRCGSHRLDIVLISPRRAVCRQLQADYPDLRVVAPPLALGAVCQFFLGRLRARAFVLLDAARASHALHDALRRRATPVIQLALRVDALHDGRAGNIELTLLASAADDNGSAFIDVQRIASDADGITRSGATQAAALLLPLVGRERKWHGRRDFDPARALGRMLGRRIARAAATQRLAAATAIFGGRVRRYDSAAVLRTRLDQPRTILCLGNGPSSEERGVEQASHDVLFRANHSWLVRGVLNKPAVVFSGQKSSLRQLRGVILAVPDAATEYVLLSVRAASLLRHPLEYTVVDTLLHGVGRGGVWDSYRPTSGAMMLAAAVALEPDHIVIAGMDMFSHPAGSYPGDNHIKNAYTPAHDFNRELAFILDVLSRHRGDLTIYGDVLAAAWAAHKAAPANA